MEPSHQRDAKTLQTWRVWLWTAKGPPLRINHTKVKISKYHIGRFQWNDSPAQLSASWHLDICRCSCAFYTGKMMRTINIVQPHGTSWNLTQLDTPETWSYKRSPLNSLATSVGLHNHHTARGFQKLCCCLGPNWASCRLRRTCKLQTQNIPSHGRCVRDPSGQQASSSAFSVLAMTAGRQGAHTWTGRESGCVWILARRTSAWFWGYTTCVAL